MSEKKPNTNVSNKTQNTKKATSKSERKTPQDSGKKPTQAKITIIQDSWVALKRWFKYLKENKKARLLLLCIVAAIALIVVIITAASNSNCANPEVNNNDQEAAQNEEEDAEEEDENTLIPVNKFAKMKTDEAERAVKNIKSLGLSSKKLTVPLWYQHPTLPSGCEAVALTNQLRYYGFTLELTTIVDKYMPYDYNDWVNAYAGSPYSSDGVTILAPGLTTTANNFLTANQGSPIIYTNADGSIVSDSPDAGSSESINSQNSTSSANSTLYYAYDVSGQNLTELFKYIERGHPVQIWATRCMDNPGPVTATIDDYKFTKNEHSMLMSSFDLDANTVEMTDSIYGNPVYDIDKVEYAYNWCGKQAVVILTDKEVKAFLQGKDASYDGSVEAAEEAARAAEEETAEEDVTEE